VRCGFRALAVNVGTRSTLHLTNAIRELRFLSQSPMIFLDLQRGIGVPLFLPPGGSAIVVKSRLGSRLRLRSARAHAHAHVSGLRVYTCTRAPRIMRARVSARDEERE